MGETNRTPEFLSKFPLGKVPTLETHPTDGSAPVYLSESAALAHFIADSGPARSQLLGATAAERAKIQEWIFHSEHEVFPFVLTGSRPPRGLVEFNADEDAKARAGLERTVKVLEATVGQQEWVAGTKELSLADLTLAGALFWAFKFWVDGEFRARYPQTVEWYLRVIESEHARDVSGPKDFRE